MRKYSFSQRTINEWNKLSNMFKNQIDKYLIKASHTKMNKWLDSQ